MDGQSSWPIGNVGFVAIVGRPNVGKSTFLNSVLGYHLVAVSAKPQTTRTRWRGILTDATSQIIFVDTPGANVGDTRLSAAMLDSVDRALRDVDLVLGVFDPTRHAGDEDRLVTARLRHCPNPVILVINKTDAASPEQVQALRDFLAAELPGERPVYAISAKAQTGTAELVAAVRAAMPSGPFFYDPEQVSDRFEREIGAELIREAVMERLHDEVPHALHVEIAEWKESPGQVRIQANLHVERKTQVGIVVGKNGDMLNAIRRDAVESLRELTGGRVDLKLHVKVTPDWRNQDHHLKAFGLRDDGR